MNGVLGFLIALVLVGDYLMLSVSRLALGSEGNWLLLVGLAQISVVGLAVFLGRGRGVQLSVPLLGCLGLGLLMLGHMIAGTLTADGIGSYGNQKVFSFFAISGPAFLLGCVLGGYRELPGRRWWLWLSCPLMLMCGIALATDPQAMTIARVDHRAVFFGILVLPVHQALAFSLGKIALWLHTVAQRPDLSGARQLLIFLAIGTCLAMAIQSGSRGYLVAVALALAAQWLSGRAHFGPMVAAGALAAAIFFTVAGEGIRDGLRPETIANSFSMQERSDLFSAALDAFLQRPLFGHGPGGFATFVGYHERVYPHNLVLEVLSEFGLAGFACLWMILAPAISRATRVLWVGDPTPVQTFAIGLLVFAVVGAMGIADLIRNHFLFLAVGIATVACAPKVPAPLRSRDAAPAISPS